MIAWILLLVAAIAGSQSPLDLLADGHNPAIPIEARKRLEHVVGRWHVRAERLDSEGRVVGVDEWDNDAHFLIDGRVVELTHNAQVLGVYSKTWIFYSQDDEKFYLVDVNQRGELWILSGGLDRYVMTSEPKKTQDDGELMVRFTHINIEPDSVEAIQEITFDSGKTWRKVAHQYLTRIP